MLQTFLKVAGPLQALLGVGGAAVPAMGAQLGTGTGGSALNVLLGLAGSYLGFQGAPAAQANGAKLIGIANIVVGALNAAGVSQIAGLPLSQGNVAMIVNFGIGLWGLAAGFMSKK